MGEVYNELEDSIKKYFIEYIQTGVKDEIDSQIYHKMNKYGVLVLVLKMH